MKGACLNVKKDRRRILSVIILNILVCVMLAGCSRGTQGTISGQPEAEQQTTGGRNVGQQETGMVTVTDAIGRQVTVTQKPQRIVSGYYINTSALIALGLEDRVVGIEAKADKRNIYALAAPKLAELPNVGSVKQFDLEGTLALKPDLVILPKKLKDFGKNFNEVGIKVLFVNPESTEEMKETLRNIGLLCGVSERAEELLKYIDEKQQSVERLIAGAKDYGTLTAYLAGNSSYLKTAGENMYQNELLTKAGLMNAAADISENYWAEISYEQLIVYNPDVIIVSADAEYSVEDLMADENLASVEAVKDGRVYALPSEIEAWDSPVPGAFLGSLWLSSRLYPEAYPFDSFIRDAKDFYGRFYGFDVTEALLGE